MCALWCFVKKSEEKKLLRAEEKRKTEMRRCRPRKRNETDER